MNRIGLPYSQLLAALPLCALRRCARWWFAALALGSGMAFGQTPYTLSINPMSTYAWGTVTSSPAGISCGANSTDSCSASFPAATVVTLTAVPLPGEAFLGWYGSTNSTSPVLTLVMNGDKNIGTTWAPGSTLSVTVSPAGAGTVTSQPGGLSCSNSCSASFPTGTGISLLATPAPGHTFLGWAGDASGSASPVTVTLDTAKNVTAYFSGGSATLTVVKGGTGTGRVTSSLGGLDCGGACAVSVPVGTTLSLTATPDVGSIFERWGTAGSCATNLVSCPLTMNGDTTVYVYFSRLSALSYCLGLESFAHLGTAQADAASAVAMGPAGSVYVVGATAGAYGGALAGSRDAWLARFGPDGTPLWVRQLGQAADTAALAVASDISGSVYLCGYTTSGTMSNAAPGGLGELSGGFSQGNGTAWLARYDAQGNRLWYQELGRGQGVSARAIAVDMEGNAYVGGDTLSPLAGAQAGQADAWVAKYDPLGYPVWIRQPRDWNTQWGDALLAIAVDQLGNVFAAGERHISTGTADAFLSKLDSLGQEQWVRYFNGTYFTNSIFSGLLAVAADGCGNVVFAGGTDGAFAQANVGDDFDAVIGKMDGTGKLLWRAQLGTDLAEAAYALALDRAGNVYAVGPTYGALATPNPTSDEAIGQGEQFWLARFDPQGALQCLYQDGANYVKSPAAGVAVDDAYNVYVVGYANGDLKGASLGQKDGFLARYRAAIDLGSDLLLTVTSAPHPAVVGDVLTYTLTVTNLGAATFTNIHVVDTLPATSAYAEASPSQGSTAVMGNQVDWTVGTLSNRAAARLLLEARPTAPGWLENQASLTAPDLNQCNNRVYSRVNALASNTPPVLRWPLRPSPTGPFGFTLDGLPGRWYEVLYSSDLVHWANLASLQNTNAIDGFVPYWDVLAPNSPYRYYRALLLGTTPP